MKNEKIKRNIAGLLALVQLGLVAGCSSKKSQEDKSETLAAIEEMQDAKAIVEEKINDLGQDIDTIIEDIEDIEEVAKEESEDIEISSIEIPESGNDSSTVLPDDENKDEEDLIDAGVVEFNEEFLKKLGIEFNISQDETIQFNISTLNDFLSKYQNVSYSVETDSNAEKGYVKNEITFKNSKGTIATVTLTKCEDKEKLWINLEPLDRQLITTRSDYDDDSIYEMWMSWNTYYFINDSNFYCDVFNDVQGYDRLYKDVLFSTYNYEEDLEMHIELHLIADTNERISLGENLNEPNGTYALKFEVANCDGLRTFKADITSEDFNNLYSIMHLPKYFVIEFEIKNALIEIIQRYASEEQSKPLIDILNNANTYTRKR